MSQFKADSGQEMKRYIEGEGKNFTLDNLQEAQMALYGPDALFLLDYIESLERPPQMTRGAFVFDEKDTSPGASPRQ